MEHSVKIVGDRWAVHLPNESGYDREILCDHLREAVRRHGSARLECPNGSVFLATVNSRARSKSCTSCGESVRTIVGNSGTELLCLSCVWEKVRRQIVAH